MTLLFGRLVQSFVNFGLALNSLNPSDPTTETNLADATNAFKRQAASNASYLVYIGESSQDRLKLHLSFERADI